MMKRSKMHSKAFTLIEVLLVIAILVVLGSVAVVGYTKIKDNADKDATKIMVGQAADAVRLYQMQMGKYPTTEEGLGALITKPDDEKEAAKWAGPYLKDGNIPVDPWTHELKYERLEQAGDVTKPPFRVFSYGPDGQEGNEDDISSYEAKSSL